MNWRESVKREFDEIIRRVLRHDAPEEIRNATEPHPAFPDVQTNYLMGTYVNKRLEQIMNEPAWPKLPRRTPILCPVTGEETTHPFGLSDRAWELIDKGVTYEVEQEKARADRKPYCFDYWWGSGLTQGQGHVESDRYRRYEPLYPDIEHHSWFRSESLTALVFALMDRPVQRIAVGREFRVEDSGWIWLPEYDFDLKSLGSDRQLYVVELTEAEAEYARRIMTMVRWKLDDDTRKAKNEGANLLYQLAADPDAIERFNAVQDKREKER